MFIPELLSPAGSLKNMRYAFAYGADAVYAGQPRYSLRVRNNEFNHENLKIGIQEAHDLGKKFYVVVNIQPHNAKLKTFIRDITPVIEMQPDALIMSDPGLIMMVRQNFPDMAIHLSVQANAVNWASVKFWQDYGIERVILSRELSLEEIAQIRENCPDIEIEVFVHGALCMAYSGRCLLSGYFNKRDPNQGACTNSCRWQYKVHEGTEDDSGQVIKVEDISYANQKSDSAMGSLSSVDSLSDINSAATAESVDLQSDDIAPTLGIGATYDKPVLLEEQNRPGEYMSAYEDEHGTYIMNSKDLRAVQYVERLTEMGVHSLKIEGRTKSFYYVARTAQVYRKAIDDAVAGKPFDISLMGTLESLAHRGYTEGFLKRHTHDEYQNYEAGYSVSTQQQLVGEVTSQTDGIIEVAVKNKFMIGSSLELMTPNGNINFVLDNMKNADKEHMEVAPGGGHIVYINIPDNIDANFGILMRNLGENESTLKPNAEANSKVAAVG